jgi:hypothetical protein
VTRAGATPGGGPDPVLVRRARLARLVTAGQRAGYALLAAAVAAFAVGAATEFNSAVTAVVTAAMAGATAVLAPSIVLGYAVRAAEREDAARED